MKVLAHMKAGLQHQWAIPLIGFALAMGLVLGLSSCGGTSDSTTRETALPWPKDDTLTLNLGKEPPTLDPLKMTDSVSGRILHEIMSGLTDFDANSKVVPSVASHWKLSPDRREYTFHIRNDARWSDGKPVTTKDFLYAWKRILTQANGSSYALFLYAVEGAQAYYNGTLKDFSQVGFTAVNDHTLQIKLHTPNSFFPAMLAFQVLAPLREDNVTQQGEHFTEAGKFITNGPYLLQQWQHDSRIILKPNPHYFDGKASQRPTLQYEMIPDQNTALTLFKQGVLDMADSGTVIPNTEYATYVNDPHASEIGISFIQYIGFNTKLAPFDSLDVRQAFCQCIQRNYFTSLLKSGETPINSFITPGLFGYNEAVGLKFNPQNAKAVWKKYHSEHPDVPAPTLMFSNEYGVRKASEILKFQWEKEMGAKTSLRALDWKVFLSRVKYDTPAMYLLGWFVDYPDADSFLSLFHSSNGNNHTGWHSKEYDALLELGATLPNGSERQAVYDKAQRILLEENTVICPLFKRNKLWLTQPWVKGLKFSSMNDLVLEDVQLLKHLN
jgi:oligopeptide transport system substrate-binding protein